METGTPVCIVGAGAMGSLIGAKLIDAGADVTLVDRGHRLAHLQRHGLSFVTAEGDRRTFSRIRAVDPDSADGEYGVVIVAVKAYDLPRVAERLAAVAGRRGIVVTLQNGIPWWYFHRFDGELEGYRLKALDPDGSLARHVDADRVVACIPYPAAEILSDGAVKHVEGFKLPVGELSGETTPRAQGLSNLLESAGFRSRILDDVRSETWLKAWGNLSFNPISALTGATLEGLCRFGPTRQLSAEMMREAQKVAERLGASFRVGIEKRIAGAEAVGPHKTSMLQDLERGTPLETDALVGAVIELADLVGIDVPATRAVYACVKLLEQNRVSGGAETGRVAEIPLAAPPLPTN